MYSRHRAYEHTGLYRAGEFSLDAFGTGSVMEPTIARWSADRLQDESRLGAGLGLNYFFTRNVGIGADAYSEDTRHTFVESSSANLIVRFPIGESLFAPYIFGGAGYRFEDTEQWFGNGGAGIEFRFTHHIGMFVDARYILADKTRNYGVGRAGLRIVF